MEPCHFLPRLRKGPGRRLQAAPFLGGLVCGVHRPKAGVPGSHTGLIPSVTESHFVITWEKSPESCLGPGGAVIEPERKFCEPDGVGLP